MNLGAFSEPEHFGVLSGQIFGCVGADSSFFQVRSIKAECLAAGTYPTLQLTGWWWPDIVRSKNKNWRRIPVQVFDHHIHCKGLY